jgi:hypothetical protein
VSLPTTVFSGRPWSRALGPRGPGRSRLLRDAWAGPARQHQLARPPAPRFEAPGGQSQPGSSPTRTPAFGYYLRDPLAPILHAHGLVLLTLEGDQISAITRFGDNSLFPQFGLPRTLRE